MRLVIFQSSRHLIIYSIMVVVHLNGCFLHTSKYLNVAVYGLFTSAVCGLFTSACLNP